MRSRRARVWRRAGHVLKEAPKPKTVWNTDVSSTTMSASPIAPGEAKLIGLGPKFVYVSNVDPFQVVDH